MPHKDYYQILGIDPSASPELVEAAYNVAATGSGKDLRIVNEAFDTLCNPQARRKYDKSRIKFEKNLINDEYEILSLIANGGFGDTYRARHLLADELVCLKHCSEISPQHTAILVQEAKAMWHLRHFSIPMVKNIIKLPDGTVALIMSYIPGPTLEKIVEKQDRNMDKKQYLDWVETVCWIIERVLNGLKYMHFQGVAHGDTKPQNIIVQPKQHSAVIVDFGLSQVKPTSKTKGKGYTEIFCAPEQLLNKPLLPQTDFFSLAKTMIYALSLSLDKTKANEVPEHTPDKICDFIRELIVYDAMERPEWKDRDLFQEFIDLRIEVFGREHSGMLPIKGFEDYDESEDLLIK